jgi:hypothetical protein
MDEASSPPVLYYLIAVIRVFTQPHRDSYSPLLITDN